MTRDLYIGVTEQRRASRHRLDDAQALFEKQRWRATMYMAGYAIECRLKATLMQMYDCRNLRELEQELRRRKVLGVRATVFTHELEVLLQLTHAINRLRQNAVLWPLFNIVNRWIPAWRYTPDLSNLEDSEDFLDAVREIYNWVEHNI